MISVSYTITPAITDHLAAIDAYRNTILTTPLPLQQEHRLRWNTTLAHITGSSTQNTSSVTTMLTHLPKHPTKTEQFVYSYKRALDWIRDEWTANPKSITFAAIETMMSIALPIRVANATLFPLVDPIRQVLNLIDQKSDHPIIMSGVMQGYILPIGITSRLIAILILTKYGYDCRGMIALDPYWVDDERFARAQATIKQLSQLTSWLEYYTAIAETAYEQLAETIHKSHIPSLQLNPREEDILHRLEMPTSRITNRDVQHQFRVSQVTASRLLTRLSGLGLLFVHGKGRSVFYTKA